MFRESTRLCEVCGAEALGTCGRCGRYFCLDHLVVTSSRRCPECELQYDRKRDRVFKVAGAAMAATGGAALVAAVVASAPVLALAGVASAAVATGAAAVTNLVRRRRFLKEGKGRVQGLFEDARVRVSALAGKKSPQRPRSATRRKSVDPLRYRSRGTYGG